MVTPLIKKPNLPSNNLEMYCCVSGLSSISKLVECVVAKQLLEHIHVHYLNNPYQSAYKAGHSTETALFYIKYEVHLSLSRGETTALVLLDLSTCLQHHRSFHSSELSPKLFWCRWLCSEVVHILPNRLLTINENWIYFIRCL